MTIKVGIFDSGIGGFTILKTLLAKSKGVEIIYLADLERNPYGEKHSSEIRLIAFEICKWFKDKNLDALLIACNTTNACALDIIERELGIPNFDLITSVSSVISSERVAILATSSTVKSLFYKDSIKSKAKNIFVLQQPCPEFVKEIEKSPINLKKINFLADIYLDPILDKNINEIILGCSHYPLIFETLRKKVPSNIKIIDPSVSMIDRFNNYFPQSNNPCYKSLSYENVKFYSTSDIEGFKLKVRNWLGISKEINLVNLRTDT